jgi:hypothetical protein
MAASLQAAATLMQPTKLRSNSLQLKSTQSVSKAFGLEHYGAKVTCSLQNDFKELAHKCVEASKIAGFALATSALVVSVCCLFSILFLFYFMHYFLHEYILLNLLFCYVYNDI